MGHHSFLELAARIVASFVSNNHLPASDLPGMLRSVHDTLAGLVAERPAETKPVPAVPIRRSVHADYLVCLECGKHTKMLKRHLGSHDMAPEEYRAKWGLDRDYPMVPSSYAEVRSGLAKEHGLGRKAAGAKTNGSRPSPPVPPGALDPAADFQEDLRPGSDEPNELVYEPDPDVSVDD